MDHKARKIIEKRVSLALRAVREACLEGKFITVEIEGYTCTPVKLIKTPGQIGYVWHPGIVCKHPIHFCFTSRQDDAASVISHRIQTVVEGGDVESFTQYHLRKNNETVCE